MMETTRTAQRLHALANLYEQGQASELAARTLDKLVEYEMERAHTQLDELRTDQRLFEQKYEMSTAEFYRRFQAGQTDDPMDFVEWASLEQMSENLLNALKG